MIVPLHERQDRVAKLLSATQGVLLPGSRFDVDPERFGESRIPKCGPADPARTAVDELLLQDAFNLRKPVLAICHGMQTMNVWLNGSLIQDIPTTVDSAANHSPGRDIVEAHSVKIESGSLLASLKGPVSSNLEEQVNSSHHQALNRLGDRLRVSAVSPTDGVVEAVESDSGSQFVLGVQWHPERTYAAKELSRDIFKAFVRAAEVWRPVPETLSEPTQ